MSSEEFDYGDDILSDAQYEAHYRQSEMANLETKGDTNVCAICREAVTQASPATGICPHWGQNIKHVFHEDCLDNWLVRNQTCPLCKEFCDSARAEARRDADARTNKFTIERQQAPDRSWWGGGH